MHRHLIAAKDELLFAYLEVSRSTLLIQIIAYMSGSI